MLFFKNRKTRKQLLKEIDELKNEIQYLEDANSRKREIIRSMKNDFDDISDEFTYFKNQVKTITANCITTNRNDSREDSIRVGKECICNEIGKQLLQYIHFENYVIADSIDEMKHMGTIRIVNER